MTAPFSAALALTALSEDGAGGQAFGAELGSSWTIGPKAHGGVLLALCANAAKATLQTGPRAGEPGSELQPLAVSASYLSPPDPGPVQLETVPASGGGRCL